MSQLPTKDDRQAWEWLTKIYNRWTHVTYEGNEEFRSPKNRLQIWYSRYYLRKIKALDIKDNDVLQRLVDIEEVVDSVGSALPNYTKKIIISLFISMFCASLFIYVQYQNTSELPEYEYNQEWFTMSKDGYMTSVCFVRNDLVKEVQDKIFLKKGTQIEPMGKMGTDWIQAKTQNGQVGFVNIKDLNGSVHLVADEEAEVFNKINDREKWTIPEGTPVTVIDRKIIKKNSFDYEYIKIRINNDSVAWSLVYDFRYLLFDQIPYIHQGYKVRTTTDGIKEYVLGRHIDTIQERFGGATSLFMNKNRNQAYYKHMIVVDDRTHYRGVNIILDESGTAIDTSFFSEGKRRFYSRFPLMSMFYTPKININDDPMYTNPNATNYFQWWDDFKSLNWFTKVIGWIVKIILMIVVLILVFCIPRGLVSIVFNFFSMTRFLPNFLVTIVNSIIFLAVSYIFFLYATLYIDSWVLPVIGTSVMYVFWTRQHILNINYNRCPSCHTLYSAIDKGSTFKGRSRHVTWGTYDKYLGTTTDYENSGRKRIDTKHYERRSTKTTEITENYLDHRTCGKCGYKWDVAREEVETKKKYL